MVAIGPTYHAYLPPYSTVYWHYKQWRSLLSDWKVDGDLTLSSTIACVKKKLKWTALMIIDSQAVKNTCNACIASKGYCFYKSTNGIKRHLAVDTRSFPFFTHCTKASLSDDAGLIEMLSKNINYLKSKSVNVPCIHYLARPRISPREFDCWVKENQPTNSHQNQVWTLGKTLKKKRSSPDDRDLCQLKRGGSSSARMLGWSGVKFRSKTLREL